MLNVQVWLLWVAISMVIGLVVAVLLYLLSKFFNISELEFKAKGYVFDVVSTGLVILVLFLFLILLSEGGRVFSLTHMIYTDYSDDEISIQTYTSDIGVTPGADFPSYPLVSYYIATKLIPGALANDAYYVKLATVTSPNVYALRLLKSNSELMSSWFTIINTVYFIPKTMSATGITKGVSLQSKPQGWFSGVIGTPIFSFIEFMMDRIDTAILFQYIFFELIHYGQYVASFLIPLGIILRLFVPTKGMGGMFLAFGLGLGFVLPLVYVYISLVMELVYPTSFSAHMIKSIEDDKGYLIANQVLNEAIEDCRIDMDDMDLFVSAYGGIIPLIGKIVNYLQSQFMSLFLFRALVYPVVSLTVVYTFIRSAGMLFGADLSEIARGLAKLI